jgi:hypothetical protein
LFVRQRTDRNRSSAQLWTLLGESLSRRLTNLRRVLRHPAARNFHEHCIRTSALAAAPVAPLLFAAPGLGSSHGGMNAVETGRPGAVPGNTDAGPSKRATSTRVP